MWSVRRVLVDGVWPFEGRKQESTITLGATLNRLPSSAPTLGTTSHLNISRKGDIVPCPSRSRDRPFRDEYHSFELHVPTEPDLR